MSVKVDASKVDPGFFFVNPVVAILGNQQLGRFAVTAAEHQFLAANNVMLSQYSPFSAAEPTGYNSGNLFTGAFSNCLYNNVVEHNKNQSLMYLLQQQRQLFLVSSCSLPTCSSHTN